MLAAWVERVGDINVSVEAHQICSQSCAAMHVTCAWGLARAGSFFCKALTGAAGSQRHEVPSWDKHSGFAKSNCGTCVVYGEVRFEGLGMSTCNSCQHHAEVHLRYPVNLRPHDGQFSFKSSQPPESNTILDSNSFSIFLKSQAPKFPFHAPRHSDTARVIFELHGLVGVIPNITLICTIV